jgi:phospholipase C
MNCRAALRGSRRSRPTAARDPALAYQWLSSNAAKWGRTVFVVTYDEHGGFFDHVAPPPIKYRNGAVAFDSAGVRVPALVAGPFAPPGVCKVLFDNTSVLQLLAERFGKPGEAYSSSVTARAATFASVSSVLSASAANNGVVAISAHPSGATVAAPSVVSNDRLRTAFDAAAKNLVAQHSSEAVAKFPELRDYGKIV